MLGQTASLCSFQGPREARSRLVSVAIARGIHLFPFRTEPLSLSAPMVLGLQGPGRVGRRRFFSSKTGSRTPSAASACRLALGLRSLPDWPDGRQAGLQPGCHLAGSPDVTEHERLAVGVPARGWGIGRVAHEHELGEAMQ